MRVAPVDPNAFLSRVKARCYLPYGQIWGLAFEFSDGTKVNLGNQGDPNTDPYAEEETAFKNATVELPAGCTSIDYYSMADSCGSKIVALVFKKNDIPVGHIDLRKTEQSATGTISTRSGGLISNLTVVRDCIQNYSYTFESNEVLPSWLTATWLYWLVLIVFVGLVYGLSTGMSTELSSHPLTYG